MLEERSLKVDLVALGLLVLCIFFALALATYDPADPPSTIVYPQREHVANVCGHAGAYVASASFTALGLGAYYVLTSLIVLDAVLLVRRGVSEPWLRAIGWIVSLVGITTLAAMAAPWLSPGPVIGAGGYLGAAAQGLLKPHFAHVGAYVLAASLVAGGLLLCTDYVLIHLAAVVLGKPTVGVGRGLVKAGKAYRDRKATVGETATKTKKAAPLEDELEDEEEEYEEVDEPEVRIAGEEEEEEYEEEEDEYEEEEVEAAEEPKPQKGVARRLASALRIKGPKDRGEREEVLEELEAASRQEDDEDYELPPLDLLLEGEDFSFEKQRKDVRRKARILEKTFANFGFQVRVVEIESGPVIAQFEVELEAGLRLSKITGLADDLAIALRVPSVRIVAPIPGKNTVGIEVPNNERQLVRMREVMEESSNKVSKMALPLFLGKDVAGRALVADLASLPHLLIAGRTGTGKSVCLNTVINSLLMTRRPDEVKLLLIDPKMVELSGYKTLPHLMHPVVTDMGKAEAILAWAVEKMEERYALLARAGVRHLSVYNQLGEEELRDRLELESEEEWDQIPKHLPYIVVVADEIADLMMTAAKEVEQHIIRLAQKSRAVGIHLVLATQKPTVDVITGLIKSNLPARISFQVASRTDSRVVLDEMGADKLLGNGDMLFLWPGTSTLLRGQCTYISDDEINSVIDYVGTNEPQFVRELVQLPAGGEGGAGVGSFKDRDELYEAAVDVVVREGRGSVSLLQRALGIGYGRAARLIDYMAEDGFVGQYNGSQAREVMLTPEQWDEMQNSGGSGPPVATVPSPKSKTLTVKSTSKKNPSRAAKLKVEEEDEDAELEDELEVDAEEEEYEEGEEDAEDLAPWEEAEAEEEYEEEEEEEEDPEAEYEEEEYEDESEEDDEEWEEEDEAEAEYEEDEYDEDEEEVADPEEDQQVRRTIQRRRKRA